MHPRTPAPRDPCTPPHPYPQFPGSLHPKPSCTLPPVPPALAAPPVPPHPQYPSVLHSCAPSTSSPGAHCTQHHPAANNPRTSLSPAPLTATSITPCAPVTPALVTAPPAVPCHSWHQPLQPCRGAHPSPAPVPAHTPSRTPGSATGTAGTHSRTEPARGAAPLPSCPTARHRPPDVTCPCCHLPGYSRGRENSTWPAAKAGAAPGHGCPLPRAGGRCTQRMGWQGNTSGGPSRDPGS